MGVSTQGIKVTVDNKNGRIIIDLPMQEPTPSASGKTLVIATTRGNIDTEVVHPGTKKPIIIGVNAYVRNSNGNGKSAGGNGE